MLFYGKENKIGKEKANVIDRSKQLSISK